MRKAFGKPFDEWERDRFLDDPQLLVQTQIEIGRELIHFIDQPHGAYLYGRAIDELITARSLLEAADASNTAEVAALQNRARVARMFIEFVDQGVTDGATQEREAMADDEQPEF